MKRLLILFLCLFATSLHASEDQTLNIAIRSDTITTNKHLAIIVPSYCNESRVEKNLRSIIDQDYENFHVYYVDDASNDQTVRAVRTFMEVHQCEDKITLIQNEKNRRALYNIFMVIHKYCKPSDVVLVIDGDDWLNHSHVFSDYNAYYNNPHVWITYGTHVRVPDGLIVQNPAFERHRMEEALFRKRRQCPFQQIRSFYAGLFQRVEMKDFLYHRKFFPVIYDLAMMLPMVEMAREHTYMVTDICYVHNGATGLNETTVNLDDMRFFTKHIATLKRYDRIDVHPSTPLAEDSSDMADVIFICPDAKQAHKFVTEIKKKVSKVSQIYVLHDASTPPLLNKSGDLHPVPIQSRTENLSSTIEEIIEKSRSNFILLTNSEVSIDQNINLQLAMSKLVGIRARACYYNLDVKSFPRSAYLNGELAPVGTDLFAWQFHDRVEGCGPNESHFTLFQKASLQKDHDFSLTLDSPHAMQEFYSGPIGICPATQKVSLPYE